MATIHGKPRSVEHLLFQPLPLKSNIGELKFPLAGPKCEHKITMCFLPEEGGGHKGIYGMFFEAFVVKSAQ